MNVLLVDPSLFTAPYDAALSAGLRANGVTPSWAARRLRPGEEAELSPAEIALPFYRLTDGANRRAGQAWKLIKGIEHVADLWRMERQIARAGIDVVHYQWAALPMMDAKAIRRIARRRPVVLTVHDTTPFNGAGVSALQLRGFDDLLAAPDHLIVHTGGARDSLLARGVGSDRVTVIPHGPLALRCAPAAHASAANAPGRWRIVMFGRLQAYKGIDVLIEALGLLPEDERARLEVIVAGSALMPLEPLRERAAALGLNAPTLRFRVGWLGEQDTADLLASADAFVFPYRAIEASGVLFLAAGFRKWIVASALGAFVDAIGGREGQGALVPPGDPGALARALSDSIGRTPSSDGLDWAPSWASIGAKTAALYRDLLAKRQENPLRSNKT